MDKNRLLLSNIQFGYNIYKFYVRKVNGRLKPIMDALILGEQMGFRIARSFTDMIFTLKHIIEKKEYKCETHIAFIDIMKASDVN